MSCKIQYCTAQHSIYLCFKALSHTIQYCTVQHTIYLYFKALSLPFTISYPFKKRDLNNFNGQVPLTLPRVFCKTDYFSWSRCLWVPYSTAGPCIALNDNTKHNTLLYSLQCTYFHCITIHNTAAIYFNAINYTLLYCNGHRAVSIVPN